MLCNRLSAVLDRHHSARQAEYKQTFRTTDHLMMYRLISKKSSEWGTEAAFDLTKAFDSIEHEAIWRSVRIHSVSEQYIRLLKKLYTDQRATVLTDVESDEPGISRGTKQDDLLSSLLFNSVLQSAMEKDTETWKEEGLGIKLS